MRNRRFLATVLLAMLCISASAKELHLGLASPNGKLEVGITVGHEHTTWSLSVDGREIMAPSRLALTLCDGTTLGHKAKPRKVKKGSVEGTIEAPLYRQATIEERYNWLTVQMQGGYSVEFRAYNDGVAYRFVTNLKTPQVDVADELVEFRFAEDYPIVIPYTSGYHRTPYTSSFESQYTFGRLSQVSDATEYGFTPLLIDVGESGRVLIMESDVESYPGLFVEALGEGYGLRGVLTPLPTEMKTTESGSFYPGGYQQGIIASTVGTRNYPWRIVGWAEEDTDLPLNDMVYKLAAPNRIGDTDWIKGGRSAWEWWNGTRLTGVDFPAGINTDTYKYHIDFAARYGLEYILIDAGWNKGTDLMTPIDEVDIEALCRYADERGVGILLWAVGAVLDEQGERVCPHYAAMGIKGFKVDYFESQEQLTVEQTYRLADVCARHKLLLDIHGIYKPTGLSRTYPNVVNYEGVFGLEQLKWTDRTKADMPRNDVTIPFIRMAAGPMDYTQGAMLNATKSDFRAIDKRPMSQGTRAHQVATYVVFDSPLVMLCDSPSNYLAEDESTRFIAAIPSVFESMKILSGKVGEWIVTARQKDGVWYVGGLTSWQERSVDVDFSFLGEGEWSCQILCDGVNSNLTASDYTTRSHTVSANDTLSMSMASGGGFAMILRPTAELE